VTGNGVVQFRATSKLLAADTLQLILSLGYQARTTTRRVPQGRNGSSSPARPHHLVTFTPEDKVFRLTRQLARQSIPAPLQAQRRLITDVRPVPTVPVRCVEVDGADHLYLAGSSWIPTHNSTLALDLARAAAVHSGLTTVIFSLEMSRNEITMRLLSAEARVALHSMRTGQLGDDDWSRLARRMSEVADAPLFIDDSPNMSMMEIRAKCRRLKQRNDLKLVIIDYLQLMSSPKRVENRQQEVSELSRSLKLLAKELGVPVIALSQLNRGPEQRTDKRPMLSDLRESGCLTADTTLLRADTGAPITLQELLDNGHQGISVWSVDEQQRIVAAPVTDVFPAGVKEVYRLRLASGREVKASGNHPFLSLAGWQPLEELAAGNRIAIPRRVPEPMGPGLGWTEDRLGLLTDVGVHGRRGEGRRQLLAAIEDPAAVLDSPLLEAAATSDIYWDRIESIEPLGPRPVFDATVKGTHNFIADGIFAHNSIEQDSDMVILLHREDAYERESPRAGEADFIVAKHRNGPTATVTVAFQGHYSRFIDMAPI